MVDFFAQLHVTDQLSIVEVGAHDPEGKRRLSKLDARGDAFLLHRPL